MLHLPELAAIIATAGILFDITNDELTGPSRSRRVTRARFAVVWALRQHAPHISCATIGALIGRSAVAVQYAIAQAERLACADADYAFQLAALRSVEVSHA